MLQCLLAATLFYFFFFFNFQTKTFDILIYVHTHDARELHEIVFRVKNSNCKFSPSSSIGSNLFLLLIQNEVRLLRGRIRSGEVSTIFYYKYYASHTLFSTLSSSFFFSQYRRKVALPGKRYIHIFFFFFLYLCVTSIAMCYRLPFPYFPSPLVTSSQNFSSRTIGYLHNHWRACTSHSVSRYD